MLAYVYRMMYHANPVEGARPRFIKHLAYDDAAVEFVGELLPAAARARQCHTLTSAHHQPLALRTEHMLGISR